MDNEVHRKLVILHYYIKRRVKNDKFRLCPCVSSYQAVLPHTRSHALSIIIISTKLIFGVSGESNHPREQSLGGYRVDHCPSSVLCLVILSFLE